MENNVYILYNKLSQRYSNVMEFPSDGFAVKRVVESKVVALDEHELCRIGTVDVSSGVIQPCDPVRIAWPEVPETLPVKEV